MTPVDSGHATISIQSLDSLPQTSNGIYRAKQGTYAAFVGFTCEGVTAICTVTLHIGYGDPLGGPLVCETWNFSPLVSYAWNVEYNTGLSVTSTLADSTGATLVLAEASILYTPTSSIPGAGFDITDMYGNTWYALSRSPWDADTLFYAWNARTGPNHSITATATGTGMSAVNLPLAVFAFANVATGSDPFVSGTDLTATTYPTPGTSVQPGSVTPSTEDLIFTGYDNDSGVIANINSGFTPMVTALTLPGGGTVNNPIGAFLIAPNGSAVNPTWTYASPDSYPAARIAVFRAA